MAPSIIAASISSRGTPCSAARKTITSNPIQPQTVRMTIAYSAWLGSCRNPYGPRPMVPSAQLISPKLGSNSCRKMIAVAMVEATTGTNTAVR